MRLAIALLVIATPVAVQAQGISFDDPKPAKAKDPGLDKMVCRVEDTVGSRLKRHKVCATVQEWRDMEDENKAATLEQQLRGQANPKSE